MIITQPFEELPLLIHGMMLDCMMEGEADVEVLDGDLTVLEIRLPGQVMPTRIWGPAQPTWSTLVLTYTSTGSERDLFKWIANALLHEEQGYRDVILEQVGSVGDANAEHRLSKAQLGLGR